MDRRRLESAATFLAIVLLGTLVVLSIVAVARIFVWDLLPPVLDKLGVIVLVVVGFLSVASALVSLILNLGIVAQRLTEITEIVTGGTSRERSE